MRSIRPFKKDSFGYTQDRLFRMTEGGMTQKGKRGMMVAGFQITVWNDTADGGWRDKFSYYPQPDPFVLLRRTPSIILRTSQDDTFDWRYLDYTRYRSVQALRRRILRRCASFGYTQDRLCGVVLEKGADFLDSIVDFGRGEDDGTEFNC